MRGRRRRRSWFVSAGSRPPPPPPPLRPLLPPSPLPRQHERHPPRHWIQADRSLTLAVTTMKMKDGARWGGGVSCKGAEVKTKKNKTQAGRGGVESRTTVVVFLPTSYVIVRAKQSIETPMRPPPHLSAHLTHPPQRLPLAAPAAGDSALHPTRVPGPAVPSRAARANVAVPRYQLFPRRLRGRCRASPLPHRLRPRPFSFVFCGSSSSSSSSSHRSSRGSSDPLLCVTHRRPAVNNTAVVTATGDAYWDHGCGATAA